VGVGAEESKGQFQYQIPKIPVSTTRHHRVRTFRVDLVGGGASPGSVSNLSMKEGSLFCFVFVLMRSTELRCYFGVFGKLLRRRGALAWFHFMVFELAVYKFFEYIALFFQ